MVGSDVGFEVVGKGVIGAFVGCGVGWLVGLAMVVGAFVTGGGVGILVGRGVGGLSPTQVSTRHVPYPAAFTWIHLRPSQHPVQS